MLSRHEINFNFDKSPPTHIPNFSPLYNPYYPTQSTSPPLDETENDKRLNHLISKTKKTLLEISSIFIFDLFPDKLTIDENKVNFIYKEAFWIRSIHSILIENIAYVEVRLSILTGTLIIMDMSNFRVPQTYEIKNLTRKNALRARKLIQGLVHAKKTGIDFNQFDCSELECNLEDLGRVTGED